MKWGSLPLLVFGFTLCAQAQGIELNPIGTYETGFFDEGGAEIVAYDHHSHRMFVVSGATKSIDIIDISNPNAPSLVSMIDVSTYGANANSVAVYHGVVAVAIEDWDKQAPGVVAFFNTDGIPYGAVIAGALPDMIKFTPNGKFVLVANEGEPNDDYSIDPEGSVSIIRMPRNPSQITQDDVCTADFSQFIELDPAIRIYGPGSSIAQDLEPEYITVSRNSKTAWVALQENNAIAVVDIKECRIESVFPLGYKDYSLIGQGIDASNKDSAINIRNWPVYGMYQPDSIASYHTYGYGELIVTANEGDSRDYDGFSEEERIKDITLDPTVFPNAEDLQDKTALGRLKISNVSGDLDGDGDFDELYSYGARSFSIWTGDGTLLFDSGDQFEQITAELIPNDFNSNNDENDSMDSRSDDKGPEPEALALAKIHDRTYAFIGLERVGGIMVYDITSPTQSEFVQYITTRNFSGDPVQGTAGDLAPEGMYFVSKSHSPIDKPLLLVANEVSGTTTIFEIIIN